MKLRTSVLAALVATVALLPGPAGAEDPVEYVALGDSFSAASGVLPLDPTVTPFCARSTRNYPHVLAAATGAQLTDRTCGGAQTKDFTTAQYPGLTTPQLDAVTADTDLVTLTIGGNDAGLFANVILRCGSLGLTSLGFGNPCQKKLGTTFDQQIDQIIYPAVRDALAAIRAKAPGATVAILGYPWILPETKGCFLKMPIASGDVPYVRAIQAHLNAVIARAADDNGVTYVDLAAASHGHDACTPIGTRWVEPALFGTNFVPVHPNALGERAMADQAISRLGLGG